MDASNPKSSPFPPASEVPLHRNPPLAPSQEMAYRNKCIQLKRRLTEIETNNDATRKRIATERERLTKMRLLRAILLNQLKEVMEVPGRKIGQERLKEMGITEERRKLKPEEGLLDDSSDESDEDDIPEPGERPTRTRRANNSYRESIMSTNTPGGVSGSNNLTTAPYQSSNLPQLAPASSFSPAAARNAVPLTSSFHVASTPFAADSPPQSHAGAAPYGGTESRYSQQSSPVQHHSTLYHESPSNGIGVGVVPSSSAAAAAAAAAGSPVMQPVRPKPPVEQFRDHMRPQLVADSYPPDQIEDRIDQEWIKLSVENRGLWEQRYEDQMMDYQSQMDQYNKARRVDMRGSGRYSAR